MQSCFPRSIALRNSFNKFLPIFKKGVAMKRKKYFLLTVVIMLSASICLQALAGEKAKLTGPFDTMRDYIAALEARGKILKIKEVDQDKYEGTAFMYKMMDEMGSEKAPAVMFENVK